MIARTTTVLAVLAAALAPAGAAHASCIAPPPLRISIARADVVFVGEVESTSAGGRAATVRVTDVWKGEDVPATVEVVGGETSPNVASSVDRTYRDGTTYLFVPADASAPYEDNACTATRPYSERVERLRPAGAAPPAAAAPDDPDASDDDGGGSWAVGSLVGVALLVALAWSAVRVRNATHPGRV